MQDSDSANRPTKTNHTYLTMKKSYLAAAAVALFVLPSCVSDEPVEVSEKGSRIVFRPEMATRATETTNANLNAIRVSSTIGKQTLFDAVDFTKDASDSFFKSVEEYYWPGDNSTIDFVAYSPAQPGGTVSMSGLSRTMTDFSPALNIAEQVDFITSKASGNKSANEVNGVELVFDHRLTQIEVTAKADNNVYDFEITGVRIGQPVAKGSYDFDTNVWTLGSDKAVYEETYDTPVKLSATAQSIMGAEGNAILLPQQLKAWDNSTDAVNDAKGAYLSVRIKITAKAGAQIYPFPSNAECTWAAIPIDQNWEAGKKYVYNLDFSQGAGYVDPGDPLPGVPVLGGPIKFTVDVNEWATQNVER